MTHVLLQQKLAQMLSKLSKIAAEFNVGIFMTNHGMQIYCIWSLILPTDSSVLATLLAPLQKRRPMKIILWSRLKQSFLLCNCCCTVTRKKGYGCSDCWSWWRNLCCWSKETCWGPCAGSCSHHSAHVEKGEGGATNLQSLWCTKSAWSWIHILFPFLQYTSDFKHILKLYNLTVPLDFLVTASR